MVKRKMTSYLATAIFEGWGEGEEATQEERIEAGQYLIDTGLGWRMQGSTGRALKSGIDAGILHYPKKHTAQSSTDYYGNPIPTHKEHQERIKKLKQKVGFNVHKETGVWN